MGSRRATWFLSTVSGDLLQGQCAPVCLACGPFPFSTVCLSAMFTSLCSHTSQSVVEKDGRLKKESVQAQCPTDMCPSFSLRSLFFCSAYGPRGLDLDARLRPPWRDTQCRATTKNKLFLSLFGESRIFPPPHPGS
jgi:hypothetical protein